MRAEFIILATLAVWVSGAPLTVTEDEEKIHEPLIRVKRTAETLLVGNHQNQARVKKSSPILQPVGPEMNLDEESIDKKAKVLSEVAPAQDLDDSSPDVSDTRELKDQIDNDVAKDLENLQGGKSEEDQSKEEKTNEDQLEKELQEHTSSDLSTESEPVEDNDFANQNQPANENSGLYNYYQQLLEQSYQNRRKRSSLPGRTARNIPTEEKAAVLAEDMNMNEMMKGRVKRDLGQDLRYIFNEPQYEDYPEMPNKRDYPLYDQEEDIDGGVPQYDDYLVDPDEMPEKLSKADLEELLKEEIAEMAAQNEVNNPYEEPEAEEEVEEEEGYGGYPYQEEEDELGQYERELPYEERPYEEEEYGEDEVPDQAAFLREYLRQRSGYDSYPESQVVSYRKRSDEGGFNGLNDEYEPIVYHGEPGIFVPVKRQFASPYVGMKKREIYPYQYGPDARWRALIAAETEKRNEQDMYERLYRLAQALKGRQREEEWK